ncbi:MAG TPA: Uma2 family endonuclease [Gemmataceae bacterium]|nr:Uma2 family endonuclease [Gemmataceae bacterium]
MATAAQKLITAEEFFRMPEPSDGSQQELVRGAIITMPPPGALHGACCSRINRRLATFVEDHKRGTVFANDTGFILKRQPDTVRGPDVAFWTIERLPEIPTGYIELPADLVVEVVSPADHYARIQRKVNEYLETGVRLVWVVDPEDRSVTVFHGSAKPRILAENETVTGEDVLPGFSCRVSDLLA